MMTYHNYDFELSGISKVQVLIFISIFQKVILISQRINEKNVLLSSVTYKMILAT